MKLIILATLVTFVTSQTPFVSLRRGGSRRGPSLRLNAGPLGKAELNIGQLTPTTKLLVSDGKHPNVDRRAPQEDEQIFNEEFNTFKVEFNKNYLTPEEDKFRKEVFIENRKKITKFNQDYSFGLSSFVEKLTPLADLLTNEFNSLFNGYGRTKENRAQHKTEPQSSTYLPSASTSLPLSVDWREFGAVTPVKSQAQCACCFAFSAAAAVEGHHFRKTGDLVDLSPQNVLDCSKPDTYSNFGCMGGYVDEAFQYIKNNPGIDTESSYPYKATDGECHFEPAYIGANVTGFVSLPEGDEEALAEAVANQGPVSVAIDASLDTFQHYSDGVYYDQNCKNKGDDLNHAVLVVGYGVEGDGTKYWIVKNSYGPDWGNGGYVKMAKDVNNHCGIATSAFYPLV